MSNRRDPSLARARSRRRGIAALEALVSVTIFLLLVGSVAYAGRIALSVMSDSMHETRLLYRVRRALDRAEEQIARCSKVSVVTLTEDEGLTLAGLENWFEQQATLNPDTPLGDEAEDVVEELQKAQEDLGKGSPDYSSAVSRLDKAISTYNGMVISSLINVTDALKLTPALAQVRLDAQLSSLLNVGGSGCGRSNAGAVIEAALAANDPMIETEPLIASEQVFFRQAVMGPGGPEYQPPLGSAPCAYFIRPMADGSGDVELVYFDGADFTVIVDGLSDVEFTRVNDTVTITLTMEEEVHGQIISRTESRSVLMRAP